MAVSCFNQSYFCLFDQTTELRQTFLFQIVHLKIDVAIIFADSELLIFNSIIFCGNLHFRRVLTNVQQVSDETVYACPHLNKQLTALFRRVRLKLQAIC